MTYAILLNNAIIAYGPAPALWPDCSFPVDGPNAEFLAAQGAVPIRSDLPHDPASEQLVPATPYLLGGEVFDRVVEPLPPPPMVPRWLEFGTAVMAHPGVKQLLLGLGAAGEPGIVGGLYVGLGQAAQGDPRTFQKTWAMILDAGAAPTPLIESLQALAVAHDLPAEFVAGLASAP